MATAAAQGAGRGGPGSLSTAPATLVLVHGAWHGPWCWELLLPYLDAGIDVRCPALPSMASPTAAGLDQDAERLAGVLSLIEGPVVLCGHSYGGMVLSAAQLPANVCHLVYLCAYLTEAGESMEASLRAAGERRPGHWIRHLAGGRTQVAGRHAARFYADCPPQTRSWAVERLQPQWAQALAGSAARPNWRHLPSTYVACAADEVLQPAIQRDIYGKRAQRVVTLNAGHSPFLSQPRALAQVLVSIAQ